MNINDYFDPVSLDKPDENFKPDKHLFGSNISIHTPDNPIDDVSRYKIALLGIPEDRHSFNKGASLAPDRIRSFLYQLYRVNNKTGIIDLGNLKPGNTYNDTYYALRDVIYELLNNQVITIVAGGTQDLSYPIYLAYKEIKDKINFTCIDKKIDISPGSREDHSEAWLGRIFEGNDHLFKFVHLAHQQYLTNPGSIDFLNTKYQDYMRLGLIRNKITISEPVLRDTDILSFDIGAIKHSDAPARQSSSPNGLYADEACQIARYAGLSDNISNFGIFEINPKYDINEITCRLASQMIWYFIDGVSYRKTEHPSAENPDFKTFIVGHENMEYKIRFYKSHISNRWWMEVPSKDNESQLISCSLEDYQSACTHEIPDIWWKAFQKLN